MAFPWNNENMWQITAYSLETFFINSLDILDCLKNFRNVPLIRSRTHNIMFSLLIE